MAASVMTATPNPNSTSSRDTTQASGERLQRIDLLIRERGAGD